jgi:hypothetical protein
MVRYKTVVTDYEGMQRCLDDSSESGWRLFSVTADTWRKVIGSANSGDPLEAMGTPIGEAAAQYSASYYLVILYREDALDREVATMSASEDVALDDYPSSSY